MTTTDPGISERKADHIELCAKGDVGFHAKTTLLEHVDLVHDSLPELALDEIDTSVTLFGKRLKAPLIIASMTGGTARWSWSTTRTRRASWAPRAAARRRSWASSIAST